MGKIEQAKHPRALLPKQEVTSPVSQPPQLGKPENAQTMSISLHPITLHMAMYPHSNDKPLPASPGNGPPVNPSMVEANRRDIIDEACCTFSEKSIRRAFLRKVHGIVCVQLLLTASIISLLSFHEGVKLFVRKYFLYTIPIYVLAIVLIWVLVCCEGAMRKFPSNVILLSVFTLTYGFVIGVAASRYEPLTVALAEIITTIIAVGITGFALTTKLDFTVFKGVLLSLAIVVVTFAVLYWGLRPMFVDITMTKTITACVAAFLLSLLLICDVQWIMDKDGISPEDYVFAALMVYTDVVLLFTYVLRCSK